MTVSEASWVNYIDRLRAVDEAAADKFMKYFKTIANPLSDNGRKALSWYAFVIGRDYGEAAAALACEMYDSMVAAAGLSMGKPAGWIEPAVPAQTATLEEAANTVNGVLNMSQNEDLLASAVGRLVKMAGVDTTLQNAKRDGAQFAWIPHGDTCPYCLAIAAGGWKYASAEQERNGHAEHVHGNCDCTYAVRFNEETEYEGYDPVEYEEMYQNAVFVGYENQENSHPTKKQTASRIKINAMRREQYKENKDKINEQKRAAYREKKEREEKSQNT